MKKRIIAIILSIVTILSIVAVPVQAERFPNSQTLAKYLDGSYTMPSVANILKSINTLGVMINEVCGQEVVDVSLVDITLDETTKEIANIVLEASGVDFTEVFTVIPHSNRVGQFIADCSLDVSELQDLLNDAAESNKKDNLILAILIRLMSTSIGVIEKCDIVAVQDETDKDLYLLVANVYYKNGKVDKIETPVYYNARTKQFVGEDGTPAIFGFYMDLDKGTTYTGINVWQRKFGFTVLYDVFCYITPALMQYHTERFKFEYDNREWMIQTWKGRYFIANGGEVGIYTREKGSKGTYYNCASDDDMMYMDLKVYHGDDLLLTRERQLHWWVTGFSVSTTAYLPSTMTLVSTITMKDAEMLKAFKGALDAKSGAVDYEINGLDVTIIW